MSTRIKCDRCGKSFNPSGFAQHVCVKQPASTMLTRKLADVTAKKKRKGFMIDTNRSGIFPEPASESIDDRMNAIRAAVKELNELKLGRLPILVKSVRNALNTFRKRRKLYKMFPGIAVN